MKTKLLALVATLGMVASASAVKINDNLSINGFIDGSYRSVNDETTPANDSQGLGIDEVEVNFNINVGNVSGLVAIDSSVDANNDGDTSDTQEGLNIEQAHFTYNISDAVSVTFGRYGSALGFEREDPAGLYTYSRAYGDDVFNLGNVDANVVEGLTVTYSADSITLAASLEEAVGSNLNNEDLNLELSFVYTGFQGVTIGGGYFFDNQQVAANERNVLNSMLQSKLESSSLLVSTSNSCKTMLTEMVIFYSPIMTSTARLVLL
jgi:hypothetical protein